MKEYLIFNRSRDINGNVLFIEDAIKNKIPAFCEDLNCKKRELITKHYSKNSKDGFSHKSGAHCNYLHGEMCEWHSNWQDKARDEYGYTKESRDKEKFKRIRIPDT